MGLFFGRKTKHERTIKEEYQAREIKMQELTSKLHDLETKFMELEEERLKAEKEDKLEIFKNLDPSIREEILNKVKTEEIEQAAQTITEHTRGLSDEQEKIIGHMREAAREAEVGFNPYDFYRNYCAYRASHTDRKLSDHLADYRTLLKVHCDKSGDEHLIEGDKDEQ